MIGFEELLLALNELENIVVVSDKDGNIRYVNKAFQEKYGYSREEAMGKNPSILKANYHDEDFYKELWKTILNGETWKGVFLNKAKSGRLIWEEAKISPINTNGEIDGFIAVKEDITYKKELEEQFYKEKYLLDELYDNAPVGVILFKPIYSINSIIEDFIVIKANPIAGEVLNRPGIVGLKLKNLLPDFPNVTQNTKEILSCKQSFEHFFSSIDKYLNMRTFPLGDDRFCMFLHDITQYKNSICALEKSEQRYYSLVEDSPALIRRFNKEGRISYVNSYYADYFNKTPEQFIGFNLFSLLDKDEKITFKNNLSTLSHNNPIIEYKQKTILPNGKIRWHKWVDRALIDSFGNIVEFQSIGMDFTQLKAAETLLENQKNRLDAIFENSIMGIGVIDINGKFQHTNKRLKELLKYGEYEDIIGKSYFNHILNDDIEEVQYNMTKLFHGELKSLNIQRKFITQDGSEFMGDFFCTPISLQNGKVNELVGLIIDISQKHKIEQELKLSERKLKKLNNTKDKLFSIIAHDIRNPFNAIIGFSTLLEKDIDNLSTSEIKEFVQRIVEASEHTFKLLEDLLTWAKSQLGQLKVKKETFSPLSVINECIDSLSSLANSKNIKLKNFTSPDHIITADVEMFKFIVRNLIHNGIKFSHPNSIVECGILGNINGYHDKTVVYIKDFGIGIRPEKQEILFKLEEFLSTAGTSREKGTGLGLSLSKEMIELNGGEIEVISKENKGSEFRLILPC